MSRKYIRQVINENFVYPNNEVYEYDIEVVQDINNNSVSGSVISFSATTVTSSSISFSLSYSWSRNNAETFINSSGEMALYSVHMLAPGQDYYKPWRLVNAGSTSNLTGTTITGTSNFSVTASSLEIPAFSTGTYYFEVRFIGHRAIYPVCVNLSINPPPTPTPTITPSVTPIPTLTPSPTPGPSATPLPTPTPTPTGASGTLYVYSKYINSSDELGYSLNGGTYLGIGEITTTNCSYMAVITGLTDGDVIEFTTLLGKTISGNTSTCPSFAGGCLYSYTFTGSGSNFVYITIDGSSNC